MASPPRIATPSPVAASLSWRWAAVLAASVFLHLFVLEWANGHITLPFVHDEPANVVTTVRLHPPVPAATPHPAAKPKHASKPPAKPHAHSAPRAIPASTPIPAPQQPTEQDQMSTSALTQDKPIASTDAETPIGDNKAEPATVDSPPAQAEAKPDAPVEKQSAIRYKVDLPPSGELKYDVQKVPLDGATIRGHGTIVWQNAAGNYQVTGEVGWLFITALNFQSEGILDDYGIAPVLYSEKHFHRSETATHFNRDERNSISFSSSTISYSIKGGEQDRGSIMWQLAGIGRGDHEQFVPGAQIDVFVAGVRDGDIWGILVVGQEEIELGVGKTLAWHVVRTPRAGTYDQKIDIWLAPQYEWYPVKIRYTDKNGDYLDMSMSSFHLSFPAAEPAH